VRRKRALDFRGIRVQVKSGEGFICLLDSSSYIDSMDMSFYLDCEVKGQK
jgi:hypothetical protein